MLPLVMLMAVLYALQHGSYFFAACAAAAALWTLCSSSSRIPPMFP